MTQDMRCFASLETQFWNPTNCLPVAHLKGISAALLPWPPSPAEEGKLRKSQCRHLEQKIDPGVFIRFNRTSVNCMKRPLQHVNVNLWLLHLLRLKCQQFFSKCSSKSQLKPNLFWDDLPQMLHVNNRLSTAAKMLICHFQDPIFKHIRNWVIEWEHWETGPVGAAEGPGPPPVLTLGKVLAGNFSNNAMDPCFWPGGFKSCFGKWGHAKMKRVCRCKWLTMMPPSKMI